MGHDYKNKKALVPNYRADILHPIDLVEDIAIAYGYEHFNNQNNIEKYSDVLSQSDKNSESHQPEDDTFYRLNFNNLQNKEITNQEVNLNYL
jgi:phenylalanyl-tRNA synthetase beta chain